MTQAEETGEKSFKIRRGKVDSLTLYEITDHELELLERGSPSSVFLNLSIALLSLFASFLIALLTAEVKGNAFTVFVIIDVGSAIAGIVLLILWISTRQSAASVISKIRERMEPL